MSFFNPDTYFRLKIVFYPRLIAKLLKHFYVILQIRDTRMVIFVVYFRFGKALCMGTNVVYQKRLMYFFSLCINVNVK